MKPHFVDRTNHLNRSLEENRHSFPHFFKVWHSHSEMELVLVTKSNGTIFVGETMERFKPGDLFLIGSEVPHLWVNDKEYFDKFSKLRAEALVVYFNKGLTGNNIFDLPEAKRIKNFLGSIQHGIKFNKETGAKVKKQILKMSGVSDFEKILTLLKIVQILSHDNDYKILGSPMSLVRKQSDAFTKMDKVYEYIHSNFKEEIDQDHLVELVSMNKSSFCRLFKKINRKTVSRYVNEMRVGYACRLLQDNNLSVLEICYESGFNNISNFNRQFRLIKNQSPTEYIRKFNNGCN